MLLLTQAQEPQQDCKVIHLTEVTCKTFVEEMKREQGIIVAWLQGYYFPEHEPPVIDVDRLLSDSAKLTEHCINTLEDDLMTASEEVFGK
jgi:HdeA/HdeB family